MSKPDHSVDLDRVQRILGQDLPAQQAVELTHGVQFYRTTQGVAVLRVHYCANPERCTHVDKTWHDEMKRKTNNQAKWDREQEIVAEAGGGDLVLADIFRDFWRDIVVEDPNWRPDPQWTQVGGFDYGKTNPTAGLNAYIDFDGGIWFCGEYYQPGMSPSQHAPILKQFPHYNRIKPMFADPTIFDLTVATTGKDFTSVARIYAEHGINILCPFEGDRSDVTFAERLFEHWANLAERKEDGTPMRKPTIHIVCRKPHDRPSYGLHPYDCPNLLWELKRMRRVEKPTTYLQQHNPSEKIVDKHNHLRDCMKYLTMSLPRPARKPLDEVIAEQVKHLDPTSRAIAVPRILRAEQLSDGPVTIFRKARRL